MDYYVNIREVLEDLSQWWKGSDKYYDNPTAFSKQRIGTKNINMCCPYHYETVPSFGISIVYPYLFNCFSCGEKGDLIKLVSYVYDISYLKAYNKVITEFSSINFEPMFIEEPNDFEENCVTEEEVFNFRKKRHTYIEQRGISDRTLQKYEIGYDEKTNSITFPVRDLDGNLLFIIRRNVNYKFFNIPKDAPKNKVLYGLNYLYGKTDTVFIVEGPIDVLSCYEAKLPAVGLMGRTLSNNQLKLLLKGGIKHVVLFLDNDEWGVKGILDAYKILSTNPIEVKVFKYPKQWGIDTLDTKDLKDPNDLLLKNELTNIQTIPFIEYYYELLTSKIYKGVNKLGRTKDF